MAAPSAAPLQAPLPTFDDGPAPTDLLRVRVEVDDAGVPSNPFVVEGGRSPIRLMQGLAALADWRFPAGAPGVREVAIPLMRRGSAADLSVHKSDLREAWSLVEGAIDAVKAEDETIARCLYSSAQHLVPSLAALDFSDRKPQVAARMNTLRRGPRAHWPLLPEEEARRITLATGIEPPTRLHWETPDYNKEIRAAAMLGASGTIRLKQRIDRDGRVVAVRTQRGLPLGLTAAHIASSCRSRWQPAMHNGEPVPVEFTMAINFQTTIQ